MDAMLRSLKFILNGELGKNFKQRNKVFSGFSRMLSALSDRAQDRRGLSGRSSLIFHREVMQGLVKQVSKVIKNQGPFYCTSLGVSVVLFLMTARWLLWHQTSWLCTASRAENKEAYV